MHRGAGRADRLGLHPQRLIQPLQHRHPETAGQAGARQHDQVTHPAQAQPHQPVDHVRLQPQGGQRQVGQRLDQPTGRRDHGAFGPLGGNGTRRATAPLPPAALGRAGPGRPRLLINRIARPQRGDPRPGIARQPPGRTGRVGDPGPHRQAQFGAVFGNLGQHRLFPAEKMRAAGQVDQQAGGWLFGHPGRQPPGPASQDAQKPRLVQGVLGHRQQVRTDRRRIAQGLALRQPRRRRLGRQRHQQLRPVAVADHRQRHRQGVGAQPLHPFRRKAREPQRQDAASSHFVLLMFWICQTRRRESSPPHTRR